MLDSLTPEEKAAAQRRALLAQYGYVEDSSVVVAGAEGTGGEGIKGESLRKREEDKAKDERRALIEKAIKEEGRRKKKRQQREGRRILSTLLKPSKVGTDCLPSNPVTLQSISWRLT